MKTGLISSALVLFVLISGCVNRSSYNIVLKNSGGSEINDAHVSYGDFTSVGGILSSGIEATHLHPDAPIPAHATVQWRTADGVLHKQDVDVKSKLPPHFSGDIYFVIDSTNNVTVVPEAMPRL